MKQKILRIKEFHLMDKKKDIGKLFKERFENFESAPKRVTWDQISQDLPDTTQGSWSASTFVLIGLLLIITGMGIYDYYYLHLIFSENKSQSTSKNVLTTEINKTVSKSTKTEDLNILETNNRIDTSEKVKEYRPFQNSSRYKNSFFNSFSDHTIANESEKAEKDLLNDSENNQEKFQVAISRNVRRKENMQKFHQRSKKIITEGNQENDNHTISSEEVVAENLEVKNKQVTYLSSISSDFLSIVLQGELLRLDKEIKNPTKSLNNYYVGLHMFPLYSLKSDEKKWIRNIIPEVSVNSKVSLGVGASISAKISDRWSLATGVNYIRLKNETADFPFSDSIINKFMSNGTRIFLNENPENEKLTIAEKIHFLEVPFTVGYSFRSKYDKLIPMVTFGASFIYLEDYKLDIYANDRRVGSAIRSDLLEANIKIQTGVGLHYKFTPKIILRSELQLSKFLMDLNENQGNKLLYASLSTGVLFRF